MKTLLFAFVAFSMAWGAYAAKASVDAFKDAVDTTAYNLR